MSIPSENPNDRSTTSRPEITVPREKPLDGETPPSRTRADDPPAAGSINPPEETYAEQEQSLAPDSPLVEALHRRGPTAKDQLDVGTAGDAARPTKTGITPTSIPPRGNMNSR